MDSGKRISDPNLTDEEAEKILGTFIRRREEKALAADWAKRLESEYRVTREPTKRKTQSFAPRIFAYAAAVAAAVVFLVFALPLLSGQDGDQLLAEAIQRTELLATRSTPNNTAGTKRVAMRTAFSAEDYQSAIAAGESLLASPGATVEDQLSVGQTYLKAKEYTSAIKVLEEALRTSDSFSTELNYYLGLAYLADGQSEKGLATLRKIPHEGAGRFSAKADKLISARWIE